MFCFFFLPSLVLIKIFSGDEILVVNGKALQGMKHADAINVFKSIKLGDVQILIGRRMPKVRKTDETNEIPAATDTTTTTTSVATLSPTTDTHILTTTQITIPVAE